MYNVLNYVKKHYIAIIIILLLIVLAIFQIAILAKSNNLETKNNENNSIIALNNQTDSIDKINSDTEKVMVDIKGAVKKPGVYEIDDKKTINDVIKMAGGLKKNATTIDINLSKIVSKEMVIYISTKSEYNRLNKKIINDNSCRTSDNIKIKESDVIVNDAKEIASKDIFVSDYNNSTANKTIISNNDISKESADNKESNINSNTNKVNINTATIKEFLTLPGIGQSKAEKIIEYRENNGNFKSIVDIKNVSGIGDSLYEKIKDYITV